MKPEDFRIGNYIQDYKNNILEINGLHSGAIYSIYPLSIKPDNETTTDSTEIKPIHITNEMLVKLGFEIGWIVSHKDEYLCLIQEGDKYYYTSDMHHRSSVGIKYIHQLQNLYFSLIGKELKYDPKS